MDDITRKVLVSTQAFLERLTHLEALTADQLTEAHMAVTAIGYQLAQAAYDAPLLAELRRDERALSGELSALLGKSAPAAVTRRSLPHWSEGVGAELTAVLQGGQCETGGRKLDAQTEALVARRLRDFLVSYHEHADPTIGSGARNAYQGGRGDRREDKSGSGAIYITAEPLQDYLRARLPEHGATAVLEVQRLMGGFSKETYIVRLDAGGEQTIVIRKDGYGLPTGSSVVSEFAVLQEVHAAGVPTPQPLWLEPDVAHFGGAFMAVGFAKGEPAHLAVPTDPATRLKWARSLAGALALLHRSTVRKDADVREVLRADIAELQQRVEERERHPHPGIALGLAWLVDHLEDLGGRPACRVHGDAGYHNMLMRNDQLLALLDWEFSHHSDPMEDLVYIKPFIDQIEAWPQFTEVYEAESGFRFEAKAARFFDVWKSARNMVACMGSLNSLLLPGVKDVPLSVAGTVYIPKFEIETLNSIIQGAASNV
ncbi:phosphotransferase family protein [Trinickia violacea]|uniref:Phosphotransferase family protein n=1 Tax=Trinickia violacea TaxID=2571746 RepID=A0A4P8IMW8_9BURK|nr:phosphotransferase family protein [Trinickia violacea]QCP50338.1 phosphotransferase family protein [Trinickia violacea]